MNEPHVQELVQQPPSKERTPFAERAKKFRDVIVQTIKAGEPLVLPLFNKNGDDLIVRAAYMEALTKLCQDEGIDPAQLRVTAQESENMNLYETTMGLFSMGAATRVLDGERGRKGSLYKTSLYQFASLLGVELDQSVYEKTPGIWPVDKGPLKNVNEERIEERANQLREQLGDHRLIVVGQAGSAPEKRFNDAQMAQVAQAIREKYPNALVVGLSDKPFLRGKSDDPEVETQLTPGDGNDFDAMIETTDINELLAFFRVADEAVMTDGYWMHLAASQGVPKMTSLFTLFKPEMWAPPGTQVVESDALVEQKRDQISSALYHQSLAENERTQMVRGIEEDDMRKLVDVVKDVTQKK